MTEQFSHQFLLQPGHWIGQGKLAFSAFSTHVRFYMKWRIEPAENAIIKALQQIEQEGELEHLYNHYTMTLLTPTTFSMELKNDLLGKVNGKGIISEKTLAWEFSSPKKDDEFFEGFEVYELQDNGDYMLHGEYLTEDQYRTIIDARIWKKSE